MSAALYPFAALVGQRDLRLALLLSATDPSLGVLLRGDKGAAKSTAARAVAELLPEGAPFVNLPIGTTEDRLLGGLDLERALRGEGALKPGLLARAHGGVLYVDEVNLLPAHLVDALLDVAASGVNVLEREGFSETHPAHFVLLGSMNPEEGALRAQLLDRFALTVDVHAPRDPLERREVLARRLAFDADPVAFRAAWVDEQERLRAQLSAARALVRALRVPPEVLGEVSDAVCRVGVTSLRADLALVRAAGAHAALHGRAEVTPGDVAATLPFVLAHRVTPSQTPPPPAPHTPPPPPPEAPDAPAPGAWGERVFTPLPVSAPAVDVLAGEGGGRALAPTGERQGRTVRAVRDAQPAELDMRASLSAALARSGAGALAREDLHRRERVPVAARRTLLLLDASGSHAQGDRMRRVKGAALALLDRLLSGDEVGIIAFRGAQADLLCPPTPDRDAARRALEYLPTGGRTPLAHALTLAAQHLGREHTTVVVFTDGRANVALQDDPWQDALHAAQALRGPRTRAVVIDTELGPQRLGRAASLAEALGGTHLPLGDEAQLA